MNRDRSYGDQKALEDSEERQLNHFSSSGPSFDATEDQQKSAETNRGFEIVNIKCRAPIDGLFYEQEGCQWKVARKYLTTDHVIDLALNCPLAIKADHLLCSKTGVIILLEDAQNECQADRWEYQVIGEMESNKGPRKNSKYRGDVKLIVRRVPKFTENRRYVR